MRTKIIATYGPACFNTKILMKMIRSGVSIIRINTKYITLEDCRKVAERLKDKKDVRLLIDIKKRSIIPLLKDLRFHYLAVSFAEQASEIKKIKQIFKDKKIKIISKIESEKGLRNIDQIISESDGIMVARGDLGEQISYEKVPIAQKIITGKCRKKNKISITATEMMTSMLTARRPTRAETTDVANAILEGSDFLMLAEETAIGRHPVLVVKAMRRIIKEVEKNRKRLNPKI